MIIDAGKAGELTKLRCYNRRMQLRKPLPILLIFFVALALMYAWATPPLEASDELWHVGMVNVIADTGQLPVQVVDVETLWEQEGSQPPLYYGLAALVARLFDRGDFEAFSQPNPHAVAGVPGALGNKNLVLHDTPHPPLQGSTLAVYALRLLSIVLGCVTVSAVYASARLLTPEKPLVAILAAVVTAFNPMFLFISASVNNDNLVTALGGVIVWQTSLMLRDGFSTRRSVALALLLALASLTKLSGLMFMPFAGLAALWVAYHRREWRKLIVLGVLVVGAWAILAGWWYLRNINLYGELFGTHTMALVAGAREETFTLNTLLSEFQGFRFAYWGVFGAVNIMTFRPFYDVMDILTVLAVIGVGLFLWRNRQNREAIFRVALLILLVGLGIVGVINWTAQTYASQGRLLFPYMAAISPLLALGLATLLEYLGQVWSRRIVYALVVALGVFAAVVPVASIAPAYAPPAPLSALPKSVRQVYARFENVELVGYETPELRYAPNDFLPVTVYWRVIQPFEADRSLYLHATLNDGSVIGRVDSFPGAGTLRASTWPVGALYADQYAIPLNESEGDEVSTLRIQVGWWEYASGQLVDATDADGNAVTSVMLDAGAFAPLAVREESDVEPVEPVNYGGVIALAGYRLEDDRLTLLWDVLQTPPGDYTVFAQVLDAENKIIGQGDAPPGLPTRFWKAGERLVTHHQLFYPEPPEAGTYQLVVGWYEPVNFTRLDAEAESDAYPLTTITIP